MSNLTSRTRSLRKPEGDIGSRIEIPADINRSAFASNSALDTTPRPSHSPSRLPIKPTTRSTTTSRPPRATGSVTSNASSLRPPPSRANIGKYTTSGLQRSSSTSRISSIANTEPVKQDRSRPPVTQSRHLRNASASSSVSTGRVPGHTRAKSSSTVTNPPSLRPPSREHVRPPTQEGEPPVTNPLLKKPAFSTLQHHFSPNKNLAPKPHPASFLVPPSPSKLPSNIAISAETAKLQNELLQLHLLHRDVSQVGSEWRASAKIKLGARFGSLVKSNENLVALEADETGRINAGALQIWQDTGTSGWGLEEKVQILDEVVSGVWNLGDTGGKYARLVRRFEMWLTKCQDIQEARSQDYGGEEVVFLEELDSGWKDDCLHFGRKLKGWRDHLRHLGETDSASSLATVIWGYRSLVRGMLTELTVMAQIETDVMAMELGWIRETNDDIIEEEDISVAGAVWRSR